MQLSMLPGAGQPPSENLELSGPKCPDLVAAYYMGMCKNSRSSAPQIYALTVLHVSDTRVCWSPLTLGSTLLQSVMAHWWLEFGHSGSIYTKEIGKHYKTGFLFSKD